MSGIDRDTIEREITERLAAQITGPIPPEWGTEWRRTAEWLAPTVEALIRQARYDALTEAAEAADPPRAATWACSCLECHGRWRGRVGAANKIRSLRDQEGA